MFDQLSHNEFHVITFKVCNFAEFIVLVLFDFDRKFYFRFDRKYYANFLSDDIVLADFSKVEINCYLDSALMFCEFYILNILVCSYCMITLSNLYLFCILRVPVAPVDLPGGSRVVPVALL